MRLSLQTDYALRMMLFLAEHPGTHSIATIASAHAISKNHLMKVALRLTNEGLLRPVRGRNGGLQLAQPASEINLGRVVRNLEDTGHFVECFSPATNTCRIMPTCRLRHSLSGAVEAFMRHLDKFTLADVATRSNMFDYVAN